MKSALIVSLIANLLILGGGLAKIMTQSFELRAVKSQVASLSHDLDKWKQATIKSYRLRVGDKQASANLFGHIANDLPQMCSPSSRLIAEMIITQRLYAGLNKIVDQVTAKLNDGDLKEPLDDSIWKEK